MSVHTKSRKSTWGIHSIFVLHAASIYTGFVLAAFVHVRTLVVLVTVLVALGVLA
jgi:hypothetical protein